MSRSQSRKPKASVTSTVFPVVKLHRSAVDAVDSVADEMADLCYTAGLALHRLSAVDVIGATVENAGMSNRARAEFVMLKLQLEAALEAIEKAGETFDRFQRLPEVQL